MCLQTSLHLTIGHKTTLSPGEQPDLPGSVSGSVEEEEEEEESDLPGAAGLRLGLRVAELEGRRGDAVQEGALRGVLGRRRRRREHSEVSWGGEGGGGSTPRCHGAQGINLEIGSFIKGFGL